MTRATAAKRAIRAAVAGLGAAGPVGAALSSALVSGSAAVGVGADVVAAERTRFEMLAEQITSAPPPLAEPLHWLIRTVCVDAFVPEAGHLQRTRVPPFPDPLHRVTPAPVLGARH